ncbi:hypothetical protein [Blastococcus atacamensis]|uniref:hypothetical protein n=1 Tax=Blastococcus atacamensis TaxID=2070508 RepID=UPI000CEC8F50|nr:hypothetical protein [Blastococcus atacamensis]
MERGTTTQAIRDDAGTDVDAAVARWAAAAGIPVSVAQGFESRTSVGRRVLRGFLLGLAVGLPVIALGWAGEAGNGVRLVLVCAVLVLLLRIAQHRSGSAR